MADTVWRNRNPQVVVAISLLLASLTVTSVVMAGEPPTEPILRVESGMHTAPITRIGVDAANRYLVTGSHDKTVRVWDLTTGRLLQIIRVPVGQGNEGKIYAVAISPDGRTVAAGGWTGYEWDKSYSIYLFNRESGRLIQRLTDVRATMNHLTYSQDGRFLVATLWGKNGIQVFRVSDGALETEDRVYGDGSYGAAFDEQGRLVTSSFDGYVRLYDPAFRLLTKVKAPGGNKPYGVSFSPDGSKIAVGFFDSPRVSVLSGEDLSLLYEPDTSGVPSDRFLIAVAWSADGRVLYAGGTYQVKEARLIRKWDDAGRGPFADLPAAADTIRDIRSLNVGGVVYGTMNPAFGVLDAGDHRTLYVGSVIADYRDNREGCLLSHDGATVQFGYEPFGKTPARFTIPERLLILSPARDSTLAPPLIVAPGLTVTGWKYTYTPRLNGRALELKPYEMSRSLAIAPDQTRILLGADWYLRLFDRDGKQQWVVSVPGVAWAVNIAGNGRVAVAALGDGTIRWYRMKDGKKLLALFPHADKKRWVLWTPSGYYDASPGAEELIGWHVNNGKEAAADFFPVSKFRSTYYRPDVIAKVLETQDEGEAVRLANAESGRKMQAAVLRQQLPPVVTILSPTDGSEISSPEVVVRVNVRSPSGEPVTAMKALVEGRPVATRRDLQVVAKGASGETQELRVSIPERDVEIAVIAENRFAASEPDTVRVKWRGKAPQEEFVVKPKLYVLAIGVSQYANKDLALGFAAKDAQDFAAALKRQHGGLYRDVVTKVLTDARATKDEILDGLDWISKETTSKDVAMVFLAGHGVNDAHGIYHFLPANADPEKLKRTGVPFSDIKNTVASLAGKALFFVDTCHSGNVMGTRRGGVDITGVVNELASAENGAVVFAASTGNQYSLEDSAWGNGAFTKALVEGLSGKADYAGKGKISVNMLDLYLSERVKELTKGKQTPTTTKPQTIPDFPIAVKR